jgi:hypothetical protein
VHSTAPVTPALERAQPAERASNASIAAVWRDTLITFCAHAPGVLALAFIGFAGASLLGLGVSLALNLHRYVHASGPFATYSGIYETFALDTRLFVVLAAQSLLGWLLASFARGAITHLALREGSFVQACVCAVNRMPALLAGTLLYGALIGFGAVGLNAWLRDHDPALDLSNAGHKPEPITLEGALHVSFVRGLNALIPDPGSPVAEFTPRLRHTALRPPALTSDDRQRLAVTHNGAIGSSTALTVAHTGNSMDDLPMILFALTLINSGFAAFGAAYDARLYRALAGRI